MACLYLVIDKDEPALKRGATEVARTLDAARESFSKVDHTYWPTFIVVRISFVPTNDELVTLFQGDWPDLSQHEVLSLYRVTRRGALRALVLPPDAAVTVAGVVRYVQMAEPA